MVHRMHILFTREGFPQSKAGVYAGKHANPGGGPGDHAIKVTFFAMCPERMDFYEQAGRGKRRDEIEKISFYTSDVKEQ
jgi:hypothetical protein